MLRGRKQIHSCSVVVVVDVVVAPPELSVLVLVDVLVSVTVFSLAPHAAKQRTAIAVDSMVLSIRVHSSGKGSAGQARPQTNLKETNDALPHRRRIKIATQSFNNLATTVKRLLDVPQV